MFMTVNSIYVPLTHYINGASDVVHPTIGLVLQPSRCLHWRLCNVLTGEIAYLINMSCTAEANNKPNWSAERWTMDIK